MSKRVLIITYYWPPSGGSGVQRWLKFVKYFRDFGIEPVVYTPQNPEFMAFDESLIKDIPENVQVIKSPIREPYNLYKIFTGKKGESIKPGFISKKESHGSLKENMSLFIRSNFFIPDPKFLWISPSVKFLNKFLKTNKIDLIISTGPPHSMHLIARKVSKYSGIPWIADFRDPWTGMYNFKYLKYTSIVTKIHKALEKKVVSDSDATVVVTRQMSKEFFELGPKRLEVISNGYDENDFSFVDCPRDDKFTLTYTGLFYNDRNPAILWRVLRELKEEFPNFGKDLVIKLIGNIDPSIVEEINNSDLASNLFIHGYMQHDEIIRHQKSAQILLLSSGREPESKAILTGKFFEYLAARRPILSFGYKDGDLAEAIVATESGVSFEYDQKDELKNWLVNKYNEYKTTGVNDTSGRIDIFSRRYLCGLYANLINSILSNKTK